MPDFSGLPLVIESSDLLAQLDAEHLILVDLTSAARYAEGHIPGAHFVDPKRTQLGQAPAPGPVGCAWGQRSARRGCALRRSGRHW